MFRWSWNPCPWGPRGCWPSWGLGPCWPWNLFGVFWNALGDFVICSTQHTFWVPPFRLVEDKFIGRDCALAPCWALWAANACWNVVVGLIGIVRRGHTWTAGRANYGSKLINCLERPGVRWLEPKWLEPKWLRTAGRAAPHRISEWDAPKPPFSITSIQKVFVISKDVIPQIVDRDFPMGRHALWNHFI